MTYTNVLEMLSLAKIPALAREGMNRTASDRRRHLLLNPEPIADFFDFFVIGTGKKWCWNCYRQSAPGKNTKPQKKNFTTGS